MVPKIIVLDVKDFYDFMIVGTLRQVHSRTPGTKQGNQLFSPNICRKED